MRVEILLSLGPRQLYQSAQSICKKTVQAPQSFVVAYILGVPSPRSGIEINLDLEDDLRGPPP
jgi:hypothetical protein